MECKLCKGAIEGDPLRIANRKTGRTSIFHPACFEALDRARSSRLADVAWRFERCADGPEGFRAQLPSWPHARFNNQKFLELASPKIIDALKVRQSTERSNLVLSAKTGTGKTAGTVALVHEFRRQAELAFNPKLVPWFLFTTASQLNNARKQVKFGTGESYLVERAISADLLILDEVGFEALDGVVFEVINERDYNHAPTIVTTGLQPVEFAHRYGSAAWRRLTETGDVIEDHGRKLTAVR